MTIDKCKWKNHLTEAGFWSKEDGEFGMDERSLAIVLQRVYQKLKPGVVFIHNVFDKKKHNASLAWDGKQHMLASGENLADTIFNAAVTLPGFLKNHPQCAAEPSKAKRTTAAV